MKKETAEYRVSQAGLMFDLKSDETIKIASFAQITEKEMYLPIDDLDVLKTSEAHYIPIQYKNDIYLVHDLKGKNDLMLFGNIPRAYSCQIFLRHKPSQKVKLIVTEDQFN